MRKCSLLTPLFAAGTLLLPTAAWGQGAEGEVAAPPAEAPATEAPPATAPAAEAPMETAQMEEMPPEAAPPPPPPAGDTMSAEASAEMSAAEGVVAPTGEAPIEEEDGGVPGWFRFDSDGLGLQLWVGASHDVGGVSIASDIYVDSNTFAEFDIGVEIPLGEQVLLIPMVGIGFDWSAMKPVSLIAPQLFSYFDFDPIYIEWWSQFFLNTVFADPGYTDPEGDGTFVEVSETVGNSWYNRLFILFNATENFSIGPQLEPTIALNDAAKTGDSALASLPVGGRVNLGYGENNTLGLFLGYETVEENRNVYTELDEMGDTVDTHQRGIVGRFTFVRTW